MVGSRKTMSDRESPHTAHLVRLPNGEWVVMGSTPTFHCEIRDIYRIINSEKIGF